MDEDRLRETRVLLLDALERFMPQLMAQTGLTREEACTMLRWASYRLLPGKAEAGAAQSQVSANEANAVGVQGAQ